MTFLDQVKPYEQTKKEWIEQCYSKSKSNKSKKAAELSLSVFSKFLQEKYDSVDEQKIIEDLKVIQHDKENYSKLYHFLNSFVQYLIAKENASRTIQLRLAMIKSFLRFNGIRIYNEDSKQFINIPKVNKERRVPMSHVMIGELLKASKREYRAFILFLASSGMRLGEGVSVLVSDVDFTTTPVTIHVRAAIAKTREERITFISKEAYDELKPLLVKRLPTDYLFFPDRVNGEADVRVEVAFADIRKRAGIESRYQNGLHHCHIHGLRSFFISQCERVHEGFGHALAGHGKYMKEYENYSDQELREFYLKIESDVTISRENQLKAEKTKLENDNKELIMVKQELEMVKDKFRRFEMSQKNNTLKSK